METKTFRGGLDSLILENLYDYPFRTKRFRLSIAEGMIENECMIIVPPEDELGSPFRIRWEMEPDFMAFSQWSGHMSQENLLSPLRDLLRKGHSVHLGFDRYNPLGCDKIIEVSIEGYEFRMLGPAFHLGIQFSLDNDHKKSLKRLPSCLSWKSFSCA